MNNYNEIEHVHKDEVLNTRVSEGENLLGEVVTAQIADVQCSSCGSKSVKYEATSIV